MPRFAFRLEALMTSRVADRDVARTRLADVLRQQDALLQQRAELERELARDHVALRTAGAPGRVDVERLVVARRYERELSRQIAEVVQLEQALLPEIEARRQAVIEADREVRVLEKLRERQLQEFRQQQARAETNQLDEIAQRAVGSRAAARPGS